MKFSNIGKIALLLGCVAFVACEEDSDYEGASVGAKDANSGVAFDYETTTLSEDFSEVEDPVKEVTINVLRGNADAEEVVPIEVYSNDSLNGVALFNIPSSVTFAAGATKASFTVTYPEAGGGDHSFEVRIPEAYRNTYANNILKYTVTLPYPWVSYNGTLTDEFYGLEAVPVIVQNVEESNKWRVVKPYAAVFEEGEEYDTSSYASYVNFVVNTDGSVTFSTFRSGLYQGSSQIYGFLPSALSSSLAEDDEYSGVVSSTQVVLYPYYYIPGLGGFGDEYAFLITLTDGVFGDFEDASAE